MGHTIRGEMPRNVGDVPMKPCIWCSAPTDLRFMPEAMPELGPQPLHMLCTADMILTFEAMKAGRTLTTRQVARLATFQRHAALTTSLQREQVSR